MANNESLIQFKRGTLAKLQSLTSEQIEEGCFYLTQDTDQDSARLFIGRAFEEDGTTVNKVVPVNQGIIKVATTNDLKNDTVDGKFKPGDFAYVETGNILAIRSNNK